MSDLLRRASYVALYRYSQIMQRYLAWRTGLPAGGFVISERVSAARFAVTHDLHRSRRVRRRNAQRLALGAPQYDFTTNAEHARRQAILAEMARDMPPNAPQDYPEGGTR